MVYFSFLLLHFIELLFIVFSQVFASGLGTCLSTRGSCVRIPLRSRLEGSQCHPPPQGGTGCGEMDDISPSPTVGPALSRPGANKKKSEASPVLLHKMNSKKLFVSNRSSIYYIFKCRLHYLSILKLFQRFIFACLTK